MSANPRQQRNVTRRGVLAGAVAGVAGGLA